MENINSILLIVEVFLSVSLIVLVLMQHGKGADAGAAFGSGASSTLFGARGSGNFLSKSTGIIATLFFIVCMALGYVTANRPPLGSVVESVIQTESETAPGVVTENADPLLSDIAPDSDLPPASE